MKLDNATGFFRLTYIKRVIAITAILLLMACSHAVRKPALPANATAKNPALTSVPACDTYLDNYLACHEAAGIYDRGTLQDHYQTMRDTLLQEANDPNVRPYLANRCLGLTQQLRDTLQDRSCTPQSAAKAVAQH